jgi:hypothetical protein
MNETFDFQGLYRAYVQCRRRKRATANAQRYEMRLLDNLFETLEALRARRFSPSRSIRFVVEKPKAREIHAADFRDRVVHHWLVPRLERLFEPIFIHDLYSNRLGKGTHGAVDRLQSFMHAQGANGWYLQLDIANFFNAIDRPILFRLIRERLRKAVRQNEIGAEEAESLDWLTGVLLRHDAAAHSVFRGDAERANLVPEHKRLGSAGKWKGLPIGNLTSQFFANVYLNELDQHVKHTLKCRHYLRYVDDFILLADSPQRLLEWRGQIQAFLRARLRLELKALAEPKPVKSGADFLGYIVYPHYRLVRRRVVGHLRERLNAFQSRWVGADALNLEEAALDRLRATLASYWGHFVHADSVRLRLAIFRRYPWLGLLFDDALHPRPRWAPPAAAIASYRDQLAFFRRQFPTARLRVQRGWKVDALAGRKPSPAFRDAPRAVEADIREAGHLRNGLKRRRVVRIAFLNRSTDAAQRNPGNGPVAQRISGNGPPKPRNRGGGNP